jgi:hypothetical protein
LLQHGWRYHEPFQGAEVKDEYKKYEDKLNREANIEKFWKGGSLDSKFETCRLAPDTLL